MWRWWWWWSSVLRHAHQDNVDQWSELIALLFRERSLKKKKKSQISKNEHKLPTVVVVLSLGGAGSVGPAVTRSHLVSIKGKCCWFLFFFWITCGIVTCFCLKRVFVPSDSPLPSFKGQLFLFPISRRERSLAKTKSCNSWITCQAMRREKPNERLSGNSPSDTRFEIFPMIDFRSTLWCLAFILKAFNVEILLSLNFRFV